jgi:hypothetical protein
LENLKLTIIDKALGDLSQVSPLLKKRIVEAAMVCAQHSGVIIQEEYEVLRALVATLNCPLPLLGVSVSTSEAA